MKKLIILFLSVVTLMLTVYSEDYTTLKLGSGEYHYKEIKADEGERYLFNVDVTSGKDVRVYIMDELNYYKYKSGSNHDKLFKSYRIDQLSGMFTIPKDGKYYFIISNSYSVFSSKKVKYIVMKNDSIADLTGDSYLYQSDYPNIKIFHSYHQLEYPVVYLLKVESNPISLRYTSNYKSDLYVYKSDETIISAGNIKEHQKTLEPGIYSIKNIDGDDDVYGKLELIKLDNNIDNTHSLKANMYTLLVSIEEYSVKKGDYDISRMELKKWLPNNFENPFNEYYPSFVIDDDEPEWKESLVGAVYLQILDDGESYKIYGMGENEILDLILSNNK